MHAPTSAVGSNTRSIAAAIGAISVVGIGLGLSIPLLSIELESRGIARTWIGLNTAMGGIATIVTAPFMPAMVRRFGAGTMLIGAILLAMASLIGFKATGWFPLWFPLRFAFGAALCVLFVVSEFWINAASPPEKRGLIMGIYATVLSLGFAAGPAILGLVGIQGWTPYLIGAAIFLAGTIPVFIGAAEAPEITSESHTGVFALLRLAPSATLAAFVFGAVETAQLGFLPIYGLRRGLSEVDASLLLTIAVLGNVLFQIPLGILSDRMDRRRLLLASATAGLIGVSVLPLLPAQGWSIAAAVFLTTGAAGGMYTIGLAHLGARFRGAELAAANSAFVMLYSVGLTLGPPLTGVGMDALDPHGYALTLAALFAVYVAVVGWRVAHVPPSPHR
ncbi:MFS transporter [Ancylobacter terrae]|uniref:MFS transporter n=1 Tax=Ancylobacter sp. sgz301288 TaxID=3342077 RepID=UPI00385B80D3